MKSTQKLKRSNGFTLVETLVAVLILVMLSSIVGVGINTAMKTYRELIFTSESDILASTVNTALSDLLRFASYEEESSTDAGKVIFSNRDYYKVTNGSLDLSDGKIYINTDDTGSGNYNALVNNGAYTTLQVSDLKLNYDNGIFLGSYTIEDRTGTLKKDVVYAFKSLKMTTVSP